MKFLTDLLSSSDNDYPAIGRVLGVLLFANLLLALPMVIGAALWLQHVSIDDWVKLLNALAIYVPAMGLTVGGMIAGTAFTESRQPTVQTSSVAVVTETKS